MLVKAIGYIRAAAVANTNCLKAFTLFILNF